MTQTNPAAVKVVVHGRVQRVFFRLSTREAARDLGLTGTVRNLAGGKSVEVVAEGSKGKLEALVEYLKHGPEHARVDNLTIEWMEYTGSFTEFDVPY